MEFQDENKEIEWRVNIQDYYKHIDWTIHQNKTSKAESVTIGKGEALYINDARWDKGEQILLGITDGTDEYVSSYSNGSFNGKVTVTKTNTYQFMVKYTGFNDSIDFLGFLTGYPWRMGEAVLQKAESNYGLTDGVIIETSEGVKLPVYKLKANN